jgi:hypothetical protein
LPEGQADGSADEKEGDAGHQRQDGNQPTYTI